MSNISPPTSGQQYSNTHPGHNRSNKAAANHDEARSHASGDAPPPKTPSGETRNDNNADERDRPPTITEKVTLAINFLTLMAVGAYTIITGALLFDGRSVAETQRKQAELQMRPWIKINDLKVAGDVLVGRDEWILRIMASIRNVGASPANNIWFSFQAFPLDNSIKYTDVQISEFIKYSCDAFRQDEQFARNQRTFAFPGETPVLAAKGNIDGILRGKGGGGDAIDIRRAIIVGFAVYELTFGERRRCTAVAYTMSRRDEKALIPVSRDDLVIVDGQTRDGVPMDNIVLKPFPLGGVYAD